MKAIVTLVLFVCLFVLGMAFSAHNQQLIQLNYFIAQGEFQLVYLLMTFFISGCVVTALVLLRFYLKLLFKNKRLNQQVVSLKEQIGKIETAQPESSGMQERK